MAASAGLSDQSRRRDRPLRPGQHQHRRSAPNVPERPRRPRPPVRCPAQARTGQLLVPSDSARRRTGTIRRSNAMQYCVRACAGIYPGKYTYRDDLSAEQMALVAMENYDRDFQAKCAAGLPPIAALRCSCVSAARGRPRRVDRGMAVNTQRGTCNGGAQAPAACCSQLLGHRLCWSPARTCAVLCCAVPIHPCMHASISRAVGPSRAAAHLN